MRAREGYEPLRAHKAVVSDDGWQLTFKFVQGRLNLGRVLAGSSESLPTRQPRGDGAGDSASPVRTQGARRGSLSADCQCRVHAATGRLVSHAKRGRGASPAPKPRRARVSASSRPRRRRESGGQPPTDSDMPEWPSGAALTEVLTCPALSPPGAPLSFRVGGPAVCRGDRAWVQIR